MDLRRSIEKAKKLRRQNKHTPTGPEPGNGKGKCQSDWIPPVYCNCRSVELDPRKALKNRCVCLSPDAPELSYYKLLRTQIMQQCSPKHWNTVMITSAVPGEGKSLTSINLALTFARAYNQTALLVDCDLKRQSIQRYLGFSSTMGLADHLQNDTPLKDLIVWPGVEKLTVISGGEPVRDSAELISSPKMTDLVEEMKSRYPDRYLFFDAPPLLGEADAQAFAPLVDCILMVIQPKTSFEEVSKALELIPQEKFLGFVLNRMKSSSNGYYYKYHRYRS